MKGRSQWRWAKRNAALPFLLAFLMASVSLQGCQPKEPAPLSIGKVWRAQVVKEGDQVVYTQGGAANTSPVMPTSGST
jgi:hypothetical protein